MALRMKRKMLWVSLTAALCTSATPGLVTANDGTNGPPPKDTKPDAPQALTERERWLFDRIEQLEKRVAQLESQSNSSAAMTDRSKKADKGSGSGGMVAASPSEALADLALVSNNPAAPLITGQAMEKGKTGAANPSASEPFAFADFTLLNGNSRTKDTPYATTFFTPEVRADVDYNYSFNHPKDDTIGGSSEVFRHGEVQVTQLGVGGDFHYGNVRGR